MTVLSAGVQVLPRSAAGPAPRRLSEGICSSILQLARGRYAHFNDRCLCEKLGDVAESRRSSLRCAECSKPGHASARFPVAKVVDHSCPRY